jgi:hypothetical protein
MDLIGMRQDLVKLNCGPPCPNDTEERNICDGRMCIMLQTVQLYLLKTNVLARCPVPGKDASTTSKFQGKSFEKAEDARNRGNAFFGSQEYKGALAAYNEAVLLAPFPADSSDDESKTCLAKGGRWLMRQLMTRIRIKNSTIL